jgi:DNA-binding NarL/FixJ family response regulator
MPNYLVIGEAGNGYSAIDEVNRKKPDVVLLDVNMPGLNGVETVRQLKKIESCQVIMLTISRNDEDLFGAISAGADGYLLKNAEPDELKKAIDSVYAGMSVLSPQVTRQVMKALSTEGIHPAESGLSSRETEVLDCLAKGLTTYQIANNLYISENTVKTHVRHILEKLEAANRAEAVSKAVQMGLIGSDID